MTYILPVFVLIIVIIGFIKECRLAWMVFVRANLLGF